MTLSKRAESARTTLFERYDELNALIDEAEAALNRLHIPKAVEYEYVPMHDEDGATGLAHALGMLKIKGKWRICHSKYYEQEYYEAENEWKPLVECAAEDRVRAVPHILALRERIVESSEAFIAETDRAIETLHETLNAISDQESQQGLRVNGASVNGKRHSH